MLETNTSLAIPVASWNDQIGSLRKPRGQRQRERHKTKGLMSRTIAVHVRYNSWNMNVPSSANDQILRCVENVNDDGYFFFEFNAVHYIQFRVTNKPNDFKDGGWQL